MSVPRSGVTLPGPVEAGLRRLGLHPRLWAGWSPNGIGEQKPRHYREMLAVLRAQAPHGRLAWRILSQGVCDGCALGVAGLRDWTLPGPHLCTTRLALLELNTAAPMDHRLLADAESLRERSSESLRRLGRLAHPMRRRRGEPGFTRITWAEALEVLAGGLARSDPRRVGIYLTSRGLTNETYYVAAKAARALGISSIDSAARVCHAPSTVGLKGAIGVAASTCSLQDVIESDLIVLWGTNPANNQPVFTKYLHMAKARGAKVVVVNPYLEPGLERYWVPSLAESAVFGTRIADLHVPVQVGGDIAFAHAAVARLAELGRLDERFIADHTEGFEDLLVGIREHTSEELCRAAGIDAEVLEEFCELYGNAGSAVIVWSMGITQHSFGVESVRALVNLGLARGNVGRDGAGLMPIRGHSGVQGGAEMGAYATALPGGRAVDAAGAAELESLWGFPVPAEPGLTAPEIVEAAGAGGVDLLWVSGGNLLEVLPDPPRVLAALERVPLRVHQDIVVTSQMLAEGDDVVLLPVATRYEQEGGGTSTTTERRVAYSPEIAHQVGEARSEWRLFAEVAARARPELAEHFDWPTNRDLRAEIARVVPEYAGIEELQHTGDAVQWGGRHLCAGAVFPTPSGRARFTPVPLPDNSVPEGFFRLTTRRGKQFNTMIWAARDPLTGAGRDAVYLAPVDADELDLCEGDRVILHSETATMAATVHLAAVPPRTVQVHWPEGNVLLAGGAGHRDPLAGIPDYQAIVSIARTPQAARGGSSEGDDEP